MEKENKYAFFEAEPFSFGLPNQSKEKSEQVIDAEKEKELSKLRSELQLKNDQLDLLRKENNLLKSKVQKFFTNIDGIETDFEPIVNELKNIESEVNIRVDIIWRSELSLVIAEIKSLQNSTDL